MCEIANPGQRKHSEARRALSLKADNGKHGIRFPGACNAGIKQLFHTLPVRCQALRRHSFVCVLPTEVGATVGMRSVVSAGAG